MTNAMPIILGNLPDQPDRTPRRLALHETIKYGLELICEI